MNRDRLGSRCGRSEIAAIRLDPLLMIAVLEDPAEAAERPKRKRPDLTMQVLDSYCDFYDLDPLAGQEPQALLEMAALTCRVSALTDLGAANPPKPGPERARADRRGRLLRAL